MSILVQKNGLLDTIQDAGCYGLQHLGINPGGAMDRIAMHMANALVGNIANEAVLEMHHPAPVLLFEETLLIALAGGDFSARVHDIEIPAHKPVLVQKGAVLKFGTRISGARVYLSLQGGFAANEWLGSCSTHLKAAMGGFNGRALYKGDRLLPKQTIPYECIEQTATPVLLPWQADVKDFYRDTAIRFVKGKDWGLLSTHMQQQYTTATYTIGADSDRMGYRLQGPALLLQQNKEMLSTAVTRGTIQLLPSGQLILLMADHQTTGGYPVPGHVIAADIPSLAQFKPGDVFRLHPVSQEEAALLYQRQEMDLQQLQNACNFRLQEYFSN